MYINYSIIMKPLVKTPSLYGSISEECAVTHRSTAFTWRQTSVPVLCAAFSAALATGAPTYAFGLYGSTLKATLHLTQSQLDTLSSANFCAGLLSWIPGLVVDRAGPRFAMTLGGVTMSIGLLGYWLVAIQFVVLPQPLLVPVLCLLGVVVFMSNSLVIGSLFKALVVSCGLGSRGSAVGAAKGYVGIGAGVYSILFDAIRRTNESELDFLPMAAFFSVLAIALPGWFLLPTLQMTKSHLMVDVSHPLHYKVVYAGLFTLVLFILWTSASFMFRPKSETMNQVVHVDLHDEDIDPQYLKAFLILLVWLGPIVALFGLPYKYKNYSSYFAAEDDAELAAAAAEDGDDDESETEVGTAETESTKLFRHSLQRPVPNLRLSEMLQTSEAWLFLWTCTIVVGSGTMMTNNMGQMVESRGFAKAAASACLALFSVAQATARVLVGELSERALQQFECPRPVFLVLTALIAVLGHAVLAQARTRSAFVAGVILSGMAFGMVWPLMVLIVGDIFGVQNHGQNYMFYDGFTSAIGTIVVSKYIVQAVYENHIEEDDGITCYGLDCFKQSQVIVTGLCLSCVITSIVMTMRTWSRY